MEQYVETARMTRGPTPTTRRSPGQGGREIRARVSREEFAAIRERAEAAGLSVPAYVLWCVLMNDHTAES